jgi:hypothetical protein
MFNSITPLFDDAKANNGGFINYLLLNSRGEFGFTFSRITSDPEVIELTSVYRKDGGAFDSTAGATISPRAVVRAVKNTLEYVAANRANLFVEVKP